MRRWPRRRPALAPGSASTMTERQHQSLGYRTPRQIYEEGLWICGRSASPTGCASPASRASSESGEMLAFAHIPTGTTASKGIDIDDSESRLVAPAVALIRDRSRHRNRPGYTLKSGSGCRTIGVHLKRCCRDQARREMPMLPLVPRRGDLPVQGRALAKAGTSCSRAATRPGTRMPNPPSSKRPYSRGRSAVRSTTDR